MGRRIAPPAVRRPFTVYVVSLGCAKNQVDAEKVLADFRGQGFALARKPAGADVLVVNTCCFIRPAEAEAVDALAAAAALKRRGAVRRLIVAGCLVSRYGERKLRRLFPEVDGALRPDQAGRLAALARSLLGASATPLAATCPTAGEYGAQRVLLSGPGTAFLKIAEGCRRGCAYCLIPSLRGPLRSVPAGAVVAEAEALTARGIGELVVVAQDITDYGRDLVGAPALTGLLDRLLRLPRLRWLRLMYANPDGVSEGLIRRLAREAKLCQYLDLPVQHASASVLRRMGRPGSGREFLPLIARLRRRIPDLVLRTTLLTGFPGETEDEHRELVRFVAAARFNRLGVFAYSREAGTRAARMPRQVPARVQARRREELLACQAPISREHLQQRVGRKLECLVEEPSGPRHVLARTAGDAPEVDGGIVLRGRGYPGEFVTARVTGATDHDLSGVVL